MTAAERELIHYVLENEDPEDLEWEIREEIQEELQRAYPVKEEYYS